MSNTREKSIYHLAHKPKSEPRQSAVRAHPLERQSSVSKTIAIPRPRGRAEVMSVVVSVAGTLFASRSADSVSIRDIAAAANINHALIHRYFGTKESLLRTVMESSARELAKTLSDVGDIEEGMEILLTGAFEHIGYIRAVHRTIIDGRDLRTLQRGYPTMKSLIEGLKAKRTSRPGSKGTRSRTDFQMRVLAAALMTLTSGWVLLERAQLLAAGLDQRDVAKVRKEIVAILQRLIRTA